MSAASKWIPLWVTLILLLVIKQLFSKPVISITLVVSDRAILSAKGCETKPGSRFPDEWRDGPE